MNLKTKLFFIFLISMILMHARKAYSQSSNFIISTTNISNGFPIISLPIDIKSALKCIDVRTGIAVFSSNISSGEFLINCKVDYTFNSLGINLYPNPVVQGAKIKFLNPPPFEDIFIISLWTLDGILIKTNNELGINIFKGVYLNLNLLPNGTYILKIESSKFMDAIKFIKAS